ncbi:hypothetical protein QTP88_004318 [Uroleucon formosanum]
MSGGQVASIARSGYIGRRAETGFAHFLSRRFRSCSRDIVGYNNRGDDDDGDYKQRLHDDGAPPLALLQYCRERDGDNGPAADDGPTTTTIIYQYNKRTVIARHQNVTVTVILMDNKQVVRRSSCSSSTVVVVVVVVVNSLSASDACETLILLPRDNELNSVQKFENPDGRATERPKADADLVNYSRQSPGHV